MRDGLLRSIRLLAIALLAAACSFTRAEEQTCAAEALVERTTPAYTGRVRFRIEEQLDTQATYAGMNAFYNIKR